MYFWDVKRLKVDIKADRLSERDKFWYMFIYVVVGAVAYELLLASASGYPNLWDRIDAISNLLILTVGTYCAYLANGAEKGTDFLGRFFSLGFVVLLRFFVGLILLSVLLGVYDIAFETELDSSATTPMDVIPFLIWYGLFYVRLVHHLQELH